MLSSVFRSRAWVATSLALIGTVSASNHVHNQGPDCAEPVCDDKRDKFLAAMRGSKNPKMKDCPLGRSELGRNTWNVLHTTAIYYPDNPTDEEKQAATHLIESLAMLYPCTHCREHFKEHVKKHPPTVETRETLSIWICKTHNAVNKILDKPQFSCDLGNLDKRWRTGCSEKHAADTLGQSTE